MTEALAMLRGEVKPTADPVLASPQYRRDLAVNLLYKVPLTDTQTYRHTDRHTYRQTHIQTDRQAERQTPCWPHPSIGETWPSISPTRCLTQTHRHTDTQTDTHTDKHTYRQTDRQKGRPRAGLTPV